MQKVHRMHLWVREHDSDASPPCCDSASQSVQTTCGRGHDPDTWHWVSGRTTLLFRIYADFQDAKMSHAETWWLQRCVELSSPPADVKVYWLCQRVALIKHQPHFGVLFAKTLSYTDSFGIDHIQEEPFVTTNGKLPTNYLLTNCLY